MFLNTDLCRRLVPCFAAEVHIKPQRLQGDPTGRLRLEAVVAATRSAVLMEIKVQAFCSQ